MSDVGPFDSDNRRRKGRRRRFAEDLSARQHGVIARWQLLELGVPPSVIDYRVRSRRLLVLDPGVYAVGHKELTVHGHWMAAVLACGQDAVLSHREAAALSDLRRSSRSRIDVTVPGRSRHRRDRIDLHRVRSLHPEDITTTEGIPVTSVPRTLLDLAEVVPPAQLRRAFEQAERMGVLDYAALRRTVARSRGRRGLKHLVPLMREDHSTAARARSDLEARFLDLVRSNGLPMPVVNAVVGGYEVRRALAGHSPNR